MDCIFCKVVNKEAAAKIIYEDEKILGFQNIHPEAPVHLLLVPKKHLAWEDNFTKEDLAVFSSLISVAKKVASEQQVDRAYKLIFNVGETGHVPHVHLHILGGWGKEVPTHNI